MKTIKNVGKNGKIDEENEKGIQIKHVTTIGILMITLGFSVMSTVTPYSISVFNIPAASATSEGNGGEEGDGGGGEEPPEEEEPPAEEEPTPTQPTIVEEPTTQELCPEGTTGTPPNCEPIPAAPVENASTPTAAPTAPVPTTPVPTELGVDPFEPINGIAAGKEVLNPYNAEICCPAYPNVVDPFEPINGLTGTNAPINTLVDYGEPCCNIVGKAVEPAILENIDGIAKQIAAIPTQPAIPSQPATEASFVLSALSNRIRTLLI